MGSITLGDCNPPEVGDFHWLYNRKEIHAFDTEHSDNPELFDAEGAETALGKSYMSVLKSLPTDLKTRFLEGRSANAEMKVFPDFAQRHIISLSDFHARVSTLSVKRCFLGFDAGFRPNPGVLLLCVETDGGFFALRGTCRVGVYDEYWVERAKAYQAFITQTFKQSLYALYSEHDPQIQDRFRQAGLPVKAAVKTDKLQSIRQLQALMSQTDQFFIVREHIDDPCPVLARKNVPQDLIAELTALRWTDAHLKTGGDPVPQDGNDHYIDALLYIIRTAKIGGVTPEVYTEIQTFTAAEVEKMMFEAQRERWVREGGSAWDLVLNRTPPEEDLKGIRMKRIPPKSKSIDDLA